jgi:hypothetical protein
MASQQMRHARSADEAVLICADHHDHSGHRDLDQERQLRHLQPANVVHIGLQLRLVCGQRPDCCGGMVCAEVPQEIAEVSQLQCDTILLRKVVLYRK